MVVTVIEHASDLILERLYITRSESTRSYRCHCRNDDYHIFSEILVILNMDLLHLVLGSNCLDSMDHRSTNSSINTCTRYLFIIIPVVRSLFSYGSFCIATRISADVVW